MAVSLSIATSSLPKQQPLVSYTFDCRLEEGEGAAVAPLTALKFLAVELQDVRPRVLYRFLKIYQRSHARRLAFTLFHFFYNLATTVIVIALFRRRFLQIQQIFYCILRIDGLLVLLVLVLVGLRLGNIHLQGRLRRSLLLLAEELVDFFHSYILFAALYNGGRSIVLSCRLLRYGK